VDKRCDNDKPTWTHDITGFKTTSDAFCSLNLLSNV